MNTQNFFAPTNIGPAHDHAPIKASGTQQRGIQHIRPVGGCHQDDAFIRFEAVHLYQQLVQGLLALVVTAAQAGTAVTSHGIDFIDKDNARRILLALLKQVTYPASANTHEHLHKI